MPASVPITGYPFEDQDTTETQYSRLFRELQDPGVMGAPGSGLLAASFPGGMVVRVTPGRAYGNGYVGDVTTDKDVEPEAAEAQSRVDRLVIRLNPTLNTATLEVLKGTRGSSVPPAITRTDAGAFDVKLYRFTVGAGAPGPTNLVDEREWVSSRVRNWTAETRPTGTDVAKGMFGFNLTTQRLELNPTGVDFPTSWVGVLDQRQSPRAWRFGRTSTSEVPAGYAAQETAYLLEGNLGNAPAGTYLFLPAMTIRAAPGGTAGVGTLTLALGSSTVTTRLDPQLTWQQYTPPLTYTHAGGQLGVVVIHTASVNCEIHNPTTYLSVVYLGG